MSVNRLLHLLDRRSAKVRDERIYGTLGRKNADSTYTVAGARAGTVIVNMLDGTYTELDNTGRGHVQARAGLAVQMIRLHKGGLELDGVDRRLMEGDEGGVSPYAVPPHAPTHTHGGSDPVGMTTPTPYAIVEADADGFIGAGWLDPADLAAGSVTSVNGLTGVVVLDPDDLVDTATTHKFTTAAEITKLAGIAAGAEVNVNADWSSGSGDSQILNKPATTALGLSLLSAASIAAAQGFLSLTPGTNVQAFDAELAAIAGLTSAADKLPYFTGSGTASLADLSAFARTLIDDAAAVNMRATLGLVIGTDVQAQDAELAAIAGLTSAADRLPYFTGLGTAALATFTAYGRTLAALADAAAGRTALALGTIATMAESLFVLLGGRAGGQTINGGTASGESLTLSSTAHATKGKIFLGAAQTSAYDGVNDRLGIGANDPASQLEVTAATTAAARGFITGQHNSSAAAALFYFQKSRNTRASPNTVNNGDFGGVFYWQLHDGTNYLATAAIAAKANGTVATGSIPTDIVFAAGAADDLGLTNERMRIKSTGEVGIGIAAPGASILGGRAGTSTNDFAVGGVLYEGHSATGNVGTGEDDLLTYSVPANTLSTNGMSLWFEAQGTSAANVNAKTLRIRFGTSGTSLLAQFTVTGGGSGSNWVVRGRIIRTGAATQNGYATVAGSNITNTADAVTTLNQTLSGAVTFKVTGDATTTNDVVCVSLIVGWSDANV